MVSTLSPLEGVVYGKQFIHAGVEYVVTHWLDDSNQPYQMSLSLVTERNGKFIAGRNVAAAGTSPAFVTHQGGVEGTIETFLSRANAYLLAQGEPPVDSGFPTDGSDLEKFNWFIKNGLSYINGQLERVA